MNNIVVCDTHAEMIIKRRNGDIIKVFIDIEDIPKAQEYKWYVAWRVKKENLYVTSSFRYTNEDGRRTSDTIYLHRFLMDAKPDEIIDHINHNTLDARKINLRKINVSNNLKNRKGANSNNKSGYRNICFVGGYWIVQLYVNKKNIRCGKFSDIEDAIKCAEEMRKKYFKEFSGKS